MVDSIKRFIWISLALLLIVGGIIVWWKMDLFADDSQSDEAKQVEGDGVDIIVYGSLESADHVKYRTVESLGRESFGIENSNQHHFLVIYDPDGKLDFKMDELVSLRDLCLNEYLDLIYIGESFSRFQEAGFFSSCEDDDPTGFFFDGYQFHVSGNPYTFDGEAWVNPDEPDTYYSNPFITWFYADDAKAERKNEEAVWRWIYRYCLKERKDN